MFLLRLSSVPTLALIPKKTNLIIQPELPSQTSLSPWMSDDVSVPACLPTRGRILSTGALRLLASSEVSSQEEVISSSY